MSFSSMRSIMIRQKSERVKEMTAATKLVYLCLGNMASDEGEGCGKCWPSVERIAEDTWMSVRAVQKHLRLLELAGWIERQNRGRHDTNMFIVFWGADSAPLHDQGRKKCSLGVQILQSRGADSAPYPISEPINKPIRGERARAHARPQELEKLGVEEETWDGFVAMRKSRKKPLTPHAERLLIGTLQTLKSKRIDPTEALDLCVLHSWLAPNPKYDAIAALAPGHVATSRRRPDDCSAKPNPLLDGSGARPGESWDDYRRRVSDTRDKTSLVDMIGG